MSVWSGWQRLNQITDIQNISLNTPVCAQVYKCVWERTNADSLRTLSTNEMKFYPSSCRTHTLCSCTVTGLCFLQWAPSEHPHVVTTQNANTTEVFNVKLSAESLRESNCMCMKQETVRPQTYQSPLSNRKWSQVVLYIFPLRWKTLALDGCTFIRHELKCFGSSAALCWFCHFPSTMKSNVFTSDKK